MVRCQLHKKQPTQYVMTALELWLLGAPCALLLGILAGLTELIPSLGPWISGTAVVVFVLIQEIESNLVEPLVMSWAAHIDALLVLLAIIIEFEAVGVIGATSLQRSVASRQRTRLRLRLLRR